MFETLLNSYVLDMEDGAELGLMKMPEMLYVTDREHWRTWLGLNHDKKKGVWLIYYRTGTGKPSIPYDDSVEEALCFGWIDGIIKKLDEEKFARKFMPRKSRSRWSRSNRERAEKMIKEGRMAEPGLARIRDAKESGEWSKAQENRKELVIPAFFVETLSKNKKASEFFSNLAPTYKRHFVGWVSSAKREETRAKRIKEALRYLEQNKKLPLR
jgi:uncharacterized protein YdeI (YjbR/CyaY-like superfamily)